MCFGRYTGGCSPHLGTEVPVTPPKYADPPSWAPHGLREGHTVALGVAQDERAALAKV